jgi:hypothetical protein
MAGGGSFIKGMFKRPPRYDDDFGVPRAVQKQLAQENLTSDPVLWNRRLAELLSAYEKNGG